MRLNNEVLFEKTLNFLLTLTNLKGFSIKKQQPKLLNSFNLKNSKEECLKILIKKKFMNIKNIQKKKN